MGTGNQGEAGVLCKEALFAMEDTGTDRCCQRMGCETPEAYGGHDHRCTGLFALLGDSRVTLYSAPSKDIVGEIENVQPMFAGLQSIQNGKNVQVREVGQLALRGQQLKWELDSLVRIPIKTHQDSTLIIYKYRQLEMIVTNLKH